MQKKWREKNSVSSPELDRESFDWHNSYQWFGEADEDSHVQELRLNGRRKEKR